MARRFIRRGDQAINQERNNPPLIPAETGIHFRLTLDPGFRRDERE